MTKANTLKIRGANSITLETPKGTMAGFRWTGTELKHSTGKSLKLNAEITQAISEAVSAYTPDTVEIAHGYEIKDGNREGWEFGRVINDAHGLYIRTTKGTGALEIRFAKEDVR